MILHLSEMWGSLAPSLADHLWQSTLFAILAGLLTLVVHKNQARIRYGIWRAASLKFLLPFSLLVDIGRHLAISHPSVAAQPVFYEAMEKVSRPFTQSPALTVSTAVHSTAPATLYHLLPELLAVLWALGLSSVLLMWLVRWKKISAVLRNSVPLKEGREVEAWRRLARMRGIRNPIDIVSSQSSLEPGIFGIVRPVLVWPEGISERLDDAHLEAILNHELCHLRRRDNQSAAIHMLVEAVFWFHPLVWWMGVRLVEERERACDEQVLRLGSQPEIYAESILKTCEFCVGSPLACMSGVTGADLKKRIIRIMTEGVTHRLDLRKKLLLGAAAILAVAVPLVFGLTHASPVAAAVPEANVAALPDAKFEVASIRPTAPQDVHGVMMRVMNLTGRFYATNVTVKMLVSLAYGVQPVQIEGGPKWLDSEHFDIQAKADPALVAEMKKLPPDQAKLVQKRMLQQLLADRFHLKVDRPIKQMPVYALVVAKHGPKMKPSKIDATFKGQQAEGPEQVGPGRGGPGEMMQMRKGGEMSLNAVHTNMGNLAGILSRQVNLPVLDRTGLKGNYDFTLTWAQDIGDGPMKGGSGMPPTGPGPASAGAAPSDSNGPSIFTALQEQLGLKLESQKGPVQVLAIDHVEQPSAN